VGYNYSGNLIDECYATEGQVNSIGNDANNQSYPYAGGLAGYNSGYNSAVPTQLSTIRNSYATGAVYAQAATDTAWAGGITASNANKASIENCYATGSVEVLISSASPTIAPLSGAVVGGIVGYNYFGTSQVHDSVALNQSIEADSFAASTVFNDRRVAGKNDADLDPVTGITGLDNNYANLNMTLDPPQTLIPGPNNVDGANTASAQPDNAFYVSLGWDLANVWRKIDGTDNYPLLKWQVP
jgi:hypothetical protein